MPGSSARILAKAATAPADEIVIDLEDAVAVAAKDDARATVAELLQGDTLAHRQLAVRVNGLDTPWCHRDVVALAGTVECLVVPKVESARDVEWVARLLDMLGAATRLQALVETAAGLTHATEIATASDRVEAVILGYADLRASLGRPANPTEAPQRWSYAQETVLAAARTAGVQAIDGPYLRIDDPDGLAAWTAHTRALGFDGKWAIHPNQVAVLDAAFSPTEAELADARAVLASLDAAADGAVQLGGAMLDEAVRKQAEQVLARGEAAAR
jgi:citrate lyase subunit beta/citryl-CoA lyase